MAISERLATIVDVAQKAFESDAALQTERLEKALALFELLNNPVFMKYLYMRLNVSAANIVEARVCSAAPDDMPRTVFEDLGLYLQIHRDGKACFHEELIVSSLRTACGSMQLPVGDGNINELVGRMYKGRYTTVKNFAIKDDGELDYKVVCGRVLNNAEELLTYYGSKLDVIESTILRLAGYGEEEVVVGGG